MAVKVVLGKTYRILGKSKYFKTKYGTCNPTIIIEDTDKKVFGSSWKNNDGNPTCILYGARSGMEGVPNIGAVYYGKIKREGWNGSLGELVNEVELEEV